MFERYTEKARRVIFFARYEASTFGSPYIESEFLLLGLLREDKHIVLRWLGTGDWQTILRQDVEQRIHKGPKTSTSVDLPLSDAAKRVLAYASGEAELLSHPHIGTEHLFLGLLREPESHVAKMLTERGVDANTVRQALAKEGAQSWLRPGIGVRSEVAQKAVEVVLVPEEGGPELTPIWRSRVPAIGEEIVIDRGEGVSAVYQVIKVTWRIARHADSHALTKALIHVRELRGTA
jgi:ATP-dependent Clp protease ATP-binding subunit ClpA